MTQQQKNEYIRFELIEVPMWGLKEYQDYLSSTHTKEEVADSFNNSFEELKSMVLELEYNSIINSFSPPI